MKIFLCFILVLFSQLQVISLSSLVEVEAASYPNLTQDLTQSDWLSNSNNGFVVTSSSVPFKFSNFEANLPPGHYLDSEGPGPHSVTISAGEGFAGGTFDLTQLKLDTFFHVYTINIKGYDSNHNLKGEHTENSIKGKRAYTINLNIEGINYFVITVTADIEGVWDVTFLEFTIANPTLPQNTPPTNITLSNTSIEEQKPLGTTVGTLSAVDPDVGDTFTYSLSGTDASAFSISGNTLKTSAVLDYSTKSSYSVTITAQDSSGNTFNKHFTIKVLDNTAPVVTGVTNNGVYNTNVTISFNEGTATLNGSPFTSGTVVSAEGGYTLVVTDAAGNSTTVLFTVDKTPPEVTGVTNNGVYNANRTISFSEGTATLNGSPFTSGTEVSTEGGYTLVVTDAAGNKTTVSFTMDKTSPEVTGVTNNGVYNTDVTISFNEGTATLNGNPFTSGTEVSTEGDYSLVVTDAAGNSTTVLFTVDKTSPEVTGVTNNGVYNTDVTISFNEGTATLNGNPFNSGTTIKTKGNYTLKVTDAAGNNVSISFTIKGQLLTVTYDGNSATSGQVPIDTNSYQEQDTVTIKGNIGSLVKIGYVFSGWNTKQDGTGTMYKDGQTAPLGSTNLILYAVWTVNSSSGGGGSNPNPIPQPIPTPEPEPEPEQPTPEPEQPEEPVNNVKFSDLSADHWAYEAIAHFASQGFIKGFGDSTFRPNEPITRQHVAVILTRVLQLDAKKNPEAFKDVPKSHPYYEAIMLVQQAGLFVGFNGDFRPNTPITRAEVAKVLALALKLRLTGTEGFNDVSAIHWAFDYISALKAHGIAVGSNDKFNPNNQLTRAEFVALLYRALNNQ
ncbi:S-layer homology domain-containing protein [Lysinibacillus sp. 54212]|uniref:S-layer homology domain-containing protein n=1 Tax=Lysinibacillus sp. 54212 TaxID=3119829 RepID=UPI002FCB4E5E